MFHASRLSFRDLAAYALAKGRDNPGERQHHEAVDPAYPHIAATIQNDPSDNVSGAVRRGPQGDEVRLPGGT